MGVDIGTGTSIVFGTSAFAANLLVVNHNNSSRPVVKTSHMGTTTNDTFMPGDLTDNGEVEVEFQFNPDNQPPISGAAETITISFPLSSGESVKATAAFSGFCFGWQWGAPMEELMTATATLKVSGAITWTDHS